MHRQDHTSFYPLSLEDPHRGLVFLSAALGFHHLFFMAPTLSQVEPMKAIISDLLRHRADLPFLGGTLAESGFYHFCHGRPGSSERKCFEVFDNLHNVHA